MLSLFTRDYTYVIGKSESWAKLFSSVRRSAASNFDLAAFTQSKSNYPHAIAKEVDAFRRPSLGDLRDRRRRDGEDAMDSARQLA